MSFMKAKVASVVGAALLAATATSVVSAESNGHRADRTIVYMTRHAEKQDILVAAPELGSGIETNFCNSGGTRCAEELSALGELRADLLAEWLERRGILHTITDVISSDKKRTRQTVQSAADRIVELEIADLLAADVMDGDATDGVRQVPGVAFDINNEIMSNSVSVDPTVEAIRELAPGSVALVAAHSGTIYRIMGGQDTDGNPNTGDDDSVGLGIDTNFGDNFAEVTLFPKKESDGKVPTFGDLWKIVINNNTGEARVAWRKNLQPLSLKIENQTFQRGNRYVNRYW
ncbi:MAG: phosphoglycerate mutase family protein [Granulosicoccus sp.]